MITYIMMGLSIAWAVLMYVSDDTNTVIRSAALMLLCWFTAAYNKGFKHKNRICSTYDNK